MNSDSLNLCFQLERFGHLLANKHRWKDHPDLDKICRTSSEQLDELFAMVPEGYADMPQTVNDYPGCPEICVEVDPFLLARYTVTNAQYQKFVDAGGYEKLEYWPQDIWPHLIDFTDRTEAPGPRYWRFGRHCKSLADHPVVGVSSYEAAAYAKWAGFRLPTEAEWQMAATWRIRSEANVLRRYPWGDALDTDRCNIWSSSVGGTAAVHEFPNGAAPNQVLQLIGNVWEWTDSDYCVTHTEGETVVSDMRMSSIRGGAFDTYFQSQATSVFRTGLVSLARSYNVGFRLAMDFPKGDC